MAEENKKGFSGIFSSLRKIIFVDEPVDETVYDTKLEPGNAAPTIIPASEATNANTTSTPAPGLPVVPSDRGAAATDDMVNKIYSLLETINKPGIDFFEFWNAAAAMGGRDVTNLQNAYKALNSLGLTKEKILSSGAEYKQELSQRLGDEIKRKYAEKTSLENKLQTEKKQLEQQKTDIEEKIKQLTASLAQTSATLSQVDTQYQPQLQAINMRIEAGGAALDTVLKEMQAVLDTVSKSVN